MSSFIRSYNNKIYRILDGNTGCNDDPIFDNFEFPDAVNKYGENVCTKCIYPAQVFNEKTGICTTMCSGLPYFDVQTINGIDSLVQREDDKCIYYDCINYDEDGGTFL